MTNMNFKELRNYYELFKSYGTKSNYEISTRDFKKIKPWFFFITRTLIRLIHLRTAVIPNMETNFCIVKFDIYTT